MVNEFRIGQVLAKSLTAYFANFIPFTIIGLVVYSPQIAYTLYYANSIQEVSSPADYRSMERTYNLVSRVLNLILSPVVTGAITFGVFQHLRGKRASMGQCLSVGFSRMLPVLGVAIVSGIAVGVGFLLLVVPGFIFLSMFYVAVPAAVVEHTGVGASLDRSRALTRGSRIRIIGLWLLIVIVAVAIGSGIEVAYESAGSTFGFMSYMMVLLLFEIFISIWQSSTASISYYHLRSMKESVDIEEVAAVFD